MSYIQFESAREKDKARQELREAREQMLDEAKKRAVQRAEREARRCLKGETNWMLPSVEEKFKARSKEMKKSKKKKDKKKKLKKRSEKKRKYSSSDTDSDSSDSDSSSEESDSSSSSSEEETKRRRKSKKIKKKKRKRSKKNKKTMGSESEESDNEKEVCKNVSEIAEPLVRDSWMTSPLMLKTYRKEKVEHKPNESQQIDAYDPTKSSRELNPYWKTTGTGLPAFRKPREDDDGDNIQTKRLKTSSFSARVNSSKSWRKKNDEQLSANENAKSQRNKSPTPTNKQMSSSEDDSAENDRKSITASASQFLTDQEMNELGAKVLKAELMGNMSLANELRGQLENARIQRNIYKERQQQSLVEEKSRQSHTKGSKREEHIVLTHTDQAGNTRPLPSTKVFDPRDMYGGKRKQKQKAVKTHNELGERVRYFADDDRYNIKEMFEREKYKSASDANLEFANIVSKHKNPNDDMEDIFAEKICKDDSSSLNQKDRERAIREHQQIEATLSNCTKCLDSTKMQKELLVCVGEKVYLALPWYQGLQDGHCMIIPNQHVACCTQIDEDTWTEINDFQKALTRMFSAEGKDVIFFEIANRLHKRPHLVIHCIPIRETDGEMAPFYFKKAIEESEHEWCINKQLVSLRNKSLRKCIPKGLPYFWVNFGMDSGFAHVIEDEERFPANFAQEIIGGMLNLDAKKWRKLQKEQNIITNVKMFADFWKKYDCTKT